MLLAIGKSYLTFAFYYVNKEGTISKGIQLFSPVSKVVKRLDQVHDPVFSSGMMEKGIAIVPTNNEVVAPFKGTIPHIAPTAHAFVLSCQVIDLMIHVGIDTGRLSSLFTVLVKETELVKKEHLYFNLIAKKF